MTKAAVLTELELKNFRCFQHHTVELEPKSLIVGKNNAGKSTCVEALRLVSLVTERMKNLQFRSAPRAFDLPARCKGFCPSLESIEIHKECLFHRYGEPPAVVTATFSNKSRLQLHIGEGMLLHALVYDQGGQIGNTRALVDAALIPRVSILPQIGPVQDTEIKLRDDYVRASVQTSRASLHFRNQIRIFQESVNDFKSLVASTWPGLQISTLELPSMLENEGRISLNVRDGDFSSEIAWMGHGVQMWLQVIWFLTRNQSSSVLILDEPDVYMHADLQRKLVRMLLQDQRQFIIATHSPEMLAEVEPESVIVLNRKRRYSKSATSTDEIQELLRHVGSVHNLSLARLGIYNRILLVEGDDVPTLKLFQNACDPEAATPIDAIPSSDIGGWSKWPSVLVLADFFRKNTDGNIRIFCVLDRDYHTDEEIAKRMKEAKQAGVVLHVWAAKELENYALCPGAIARVISAEAGSSVTSKMVEDVINTAADELKEETVDSYSEFIRIRDKLGANKSNPVARQVVMSRWKQLGGPFVVSGKQLFSQAAKWSQAKHKVCLNLRKVIREFRANEVPTEVRRAISEIAGLGG